MRAPAWFEAPLHVATDARAEMAAWAACERPVFVGASRQPTDAVARDDRSPEDIVSVAELYEYVQSALAAQW